MDKTELTNKINEAKDAVSGGEKAYLSFDLTDSTTATDECTPAPSRILANVPTPPKRKLTDCVKTKS